jgi:hypothetical protein
MGLTVGRKWPISREKHVDPGCRRGDLVDASALVAVAQEQRPACGLGTPLTRSGCLPTCSTPTGAVPYLSCQANSACRAKSPESNHRHKPTPKWDWSTTERETHVRHVITSVLYVAALCAAVVLVVGVMDGAHNHRACRPPPTRSSPRDPQRLQKSREAEIARRDREDPRRRLRPGCAKPTKHSFDVYGDRAVAGEGKALAAGAAGVQG